MIELTCRDLTLGYEGKIVLKGVNFSVSSGDYLSIVGENGSGKSTLMKTILSLQKPIHGAVIFDESVKKTDIGYLPQQTWIQKDFPASVGEIVLSGCLNSSGFNPFYTKKQRALAKKSMEQLGIGALEKTCYRELSGGQQQRVLLARALCAAKRILLLDEPVAGLDPLVTEELYAVIEKLNREQGLTVIMISHDMEASIKYSSHVLYVGESAFFGTKQEFLDSDFGAKLKKKEA